MNDFPKFGVRLEPHLRAGFGAPEAEGPSGLQGEGLQATGGRRDSEVPGRRAPSCGQLLPLQWRNWAGLGTLQDRSSGEPTATEMTTKHAALHLLMPLGKQFQKVQTTLPGLVKQEQITLV